MTPYQEKIYNNPFRILGVYANASIKDIKANEAKAKAFLNVGRNVTYPCDFNQLLLPIQRTAEMMASANSQLTLPNEKIKHALFWFVKVTPLDEIAFNHLANGHSEQTMGIWKKKECFSSLLNTSTQALAQGHVLKAVDTMMTLLESDTYRQDFIKSVTDETFQISEEELVHAYLDKLIPDSIYPLLELSTLSDKYKGYIKDKLVAPVIADIESEITKAKSIKRENSSARYNAGVQLMNLAKNELAELKKLLLGSDMRYQIIADKLGLEILQCGIDYYNNSDDADSAHKAMKLQSYAQSVVVGQMAKDRCKQNMEILKKIIAELPPMEVIEEDRAVRKELDRFYTSNDRILSAFYLLKNTRSYLETIKYTLGNNNAYYLKLSSTCVENALSNIIEEVNSCKEKNILRSAYDTILLIGMFDMEIEIRNRYEQNLLILKMICENQGIINKFSSNKSSRWQAALLLHIICIIIGCAIASYNPRDSESIMLWSIGIGALSWLYMYIDKGEVDSDIWVQLTRLGCLGVLLIIPCIAGYWLYKLIKELLNLIKKNMKKLLLLTILFISVSSYGNSKDSIAIANLQQQVNKQERFIGNLRKDIRSSVNIQKQQAIFIDSLKQELMNTKNDLSDLSNKLGVDITNTQNQITVNTNNLNDNIKSKTTWGIMIITIIILVMAAIYLILYKRVEKGKSAIDKIKDTQKSIQEESLKLDSKLVELLNQQLNVQANISSNDSNTQIDHSLALKVADEIVRIEMNLSRMDASIKGHKQLSKAVERIKNNFLANGYEMVDMLGKPYNDGMKVVANFVSDENLKDGEQIITGIIKPQVNYNGKMIQAAQITVSQNV